MFSNIKTNKGKDGDQVFVADTKVVVGSKTEHRTHVVIETVDSVHPSNSDTLAHGHPQQGNTTGGVRIEQFEQINPPLSNCIVGNFH